MSSGEDVLPRDRTRRRDSETPDSDGLPTDPIGTRAASLWSDAWQQLRRNPLFLVSALLVTTFAVMSLWPGLFTDTDPHACSLSNSVGRPTADHPFGFDIQGCDYYARVIYGARVSMAVGVLTVLAAGLVAVVLGSAAGYYGGWVDAVLARLTDVWFAIPLVLGAIVLLTSTFSSRGLPQVIFVIALFGWPSMMRLMRSSVLSSKEEDYVLAARALGAGDLRILRLHILPNAMAPVIVYATILIGIVIATEATLSFLGVGLQLPAISWGLMISVAQGQIRRAPHLLLFPGAFLAVMVFSFILMGDALRDALDPKLR